MSEDELNEGEQNSRNNRNLSEWELEENSKMVRARDVILKIGLANEIGLNGGLESPNDVGLGVGLIRQEGLTTGEEKSLLENQNSKSETEEVGLEGREICLDIEDEFFNSIQNRKKKKQLNKKILSMRVIQVVFCHPRKNKKGIGL